jgi:hypothetical protein
MKLAPFTPGQVESLNAYQHCGVLHPFTCGRDRTDEKHADGDVLVATEAGWHCPSCDYAQSWCHDWMADWSWKS